MTTWNHVQGTNGCTNCERAEHEHVWICSCGQELNWADKLLPVYCPCGSRDATLYCPKKRLWSTVALVVGVCLSVGYFIGWLLAKAFQ